jgi:signal transduction histidine kinase
MAVTLVVLLALLIPVASQLAQVERDRIVTALERDAFVLAGRSAAELSAPRSATALTELARSYRESTEARIVIVDASGTAVVTSDDDNAAVGDPFSSRPEIATALAGRVATGTRFSDTLGFDLLYVAVPVLRGNDVLGAVRLTYPATTVNETVDAKVRGLGLVALATVVLAGLVGWILATTVTRRLRELTRLTERFAEGGLDRRADERVGASELRSLARSFNGMADRLTGVLDQQRRFAADAAHQLRTPLTALRLRLDRARSLADDDAVDERIVAAEAEVDRLDTLVEGLLHLSRGEGAMLELTRVDLASVARDRVEHWRPLAEERGVSVTFDGAPLAVLASAAALDQIIDTYVDNALEVAPEGSAIIVRVAASHRGGAVHVLDAGPGLPEADLDRAFERFWRGRADTHGSGLGLSIVAQLALSSGGRATLANRPDGGLDASVEYPKH